MLQPKTVNLELGKPTVHEALVRLASEIAIARHEGHQLLKLIHGYGSSGVGGEIRIAIQSRLQKMADAGRFVLRSMEKIGPKAMNGHGGYFPLART